MNKNDKPEYRKLILWLITGFMSWFLFGVVLVIAKYVFGVSFLGSLALGAVPWFTLQIAKEFMEERW